MLLQASHGIFCICLRRRGVAVYRVTPSCHGLRGSGGHRGSWRDLIREVGGSFADLRMESPGIAASVVAQIVSRRITGKTKKTVALAATAFFLYNDSCEELGQKLFHLRVVRRKHAYKHRARQGSNARKRQTEVAMGYLYVPGQDAKLL